MLNKVLDSIIEITRQRDFDSLEHSLLTTVAGLAPVVDVALYKCLVNAQPGKVEKIVRPDARLDNTGTGSGWNMSSIVNADPYLEKCLSDGSLLQYEDSRGLKRLLIPAFLDEQPCGALSLESHEDLSPHLPLLDGIMKIYSNNLTLLNESERDKLTGLLNRGAFDGKLARLLKLQSERKPKYAECIEDRRRVEPGSNAWLAMLDIDHFKQINDTHGHLYGDEVILILSQKMKQCFRSSDLLFRIGGEEFVIILEPVPLKRAAQALDRFRKTISEHDFPQIGRVTVSIGFTKIRENDYSPVILDCADKALYYAKEHGRNRVCNYEKLVTEGRLTERDINGTVDIF